MTSLNIAISLYHDNFCILIHNHKYRLTAAIDAPDTYIISKMLREKGWFLTHIFNTHHHIDHTRANLNLKKFFNCTIFGPLEESSKIPGIDHGLSDGDTFDFGSHPIKIIATPGHTIGHICYHFMNDHFLCVGDTLFSLGCGRIFEDSYAEMFESLEKIKSFSDKTHIYFGHEYTENNAYFALSCDPHNLELQKYCSKVKSMRSQNLYTNPSTISLEKKVNPFLRIENTSLRKNLNMENASNLAVFTELRIRKNQSK
ncbi:hydroxyacylglutathione hydrolase [Candidatus Liberibacter asiaticus]|uniref:Hydroxyacylglutathione hydrolase n=2 Tax=Liberibacter asiaticus TaxID=34021 RepID=C6XFA3_LIBAP|nr:hydroxyacylglutathione hydrolase [Candidatus Liberibacter asiaticus]ACT57056.1 glyoxalase II [Candidatus Liberibacter asiaticus str. psy62]AGH16979.1 glyoxalase II [Candidatus Liberibacter asiaticus str. gxpsy]ALK07315.1 hydroxyacylglutathione hydrolase [Candidatus Liberibacter asiaticus]ASK52806.1 hydroxyacylglutathione hydrolase [Candidatus Liberibacter asiaticus]AWL14123.1 hydroxyacylglutathione hydrolase [Candidatus Liberibacter asiaticus]